ncbi:unnamed protein product [Bursaphelenchus xylophilus]|uniref:F-ATPase delta subunit n=1 Tax=Bursaphelenchus xylophilus TaxID=6326 RepID=A0A1I7SV81_BURXY|nr:F58 [Bursaphelenchus xylophilus]CAD5217444.1 unnamed protein product [Bursaphelenchus xylophilus]CAG9101037.1 unnamed protein product [Bursaphelenchus xylophilus]
MLRSAVSALRFVPRRAYAAAAQKSASEELLLTLASPSASFFNKEVVKQVDVPTQAGVVGVLASHVPTIGVLKPGVVSVTKADGSQVKLFVSSGTLSVNIDGSCQVLAEEIVQVEDIDESAARQELDAAQRKTGEGSEVDRAEASIRAEVAEALLKAATGQQ